VQYRLLLAVALLLAGRALQADELHLKNGSVLIGKLVTAEDNMVVFDTPFAGKITVKEDHIQQLTTDADVTLQLEGGQVLRDRSISATSGTGQLVAQAPGQEPIAFTAADIKLINPEPWKLGDGWRWSGNVSVLLDTQRGNSDTDEWDFQGNTEWRSLYNRFIVRGVMEQDKANNEKTADNWILRLKYDRFSKRRPENYAGFRTWFDYDKFADLNLRTTLGPYLGRQFFERPILNVKGEIGPVYVDEDFDVADDNDFYGGLWEMEITSNILGFGTTLYGAHDGTISFSNSDDYILNTRLGLRMPVILGLQSGFEALWEYDNGAVEGVDKLDQTYSFRIGYEW